MSRVSKITTAEQLRTMINLRGYVAIIFVGINDWPSNQFAEKCAEYSRTFPYVRFATAPVELAGACVGGTHLTFIPTTAIYRNGILCMQVVGTDYLGIEKILVATRKDGYSLTTLAPVGGNYMLLAPPNLPIFPARRKK